MDTARLKVAKSGFARCSQRSRRDIISQDTSSRTHTHTHVTGVRLRIIINTHGGSSKMESEPLSLFCMPVSHFCCLAMNQSRTTASHESSRVVRTESPGWGGSWRRMMRGKRSQIEATSPPPTAHRTPPRRGTAGRKDLWNPANMCPVRGSPSRETR